MPGYDLYSITPRTGDGRPTRIGAADVRRVQDLTAAFRAVDYQYGGGSCRDAVIAMLSWGHQLLAASGRDAVRTGLHVAVADLHNLAGWTSFDTGMVETARRHFDYALELAKESGDTTLVSNVLYRMGRVHLHHRSPEEALTLFRLGQSVAESPLATSILCTNEAWAYAKMGSSAPALKLLGEARDAFAKADLDSAPPWARFFTEADLTAMIGTVHTELAQAGEPAHTRQAIPALTAALDGYGEGTARSRTFNLISLSLNHLIEGDADRAAEVGGEAIELAAMIKSTRARDRIWPVKKQADKLRGNAAAAELADRVLMFVGALPAAA
jgi:tetratricopeptide (TPR) repeat protein